MDNPERIGRYEILERIGRGGMGVLYRGRDPVLDREVAIKVMLADVSANEQVRPRFYQEARAAAKLQHRNIVTIFEFGIEGDSPYIVMEFLRGQDLAQRVQADPPLSVDDRLRVVQELCEGLDFAHAQGVVHRDVKPGNIWLQLDGSVKLLDFGIAKMAASTLTQDGNVLGSASYMSPEQVAGRAVDSRADIFSAGVVLYELLTGRRPFEGETTTEVLMKILSAEPPPIGECAPGLAVPLGDVLRRALAKEPSDRYARAADLAEDLRTLARSPKGAEGAELAETMWAAPETALYRPKTGEGAWRPATGSATHAAPSRAASAARRPSGRTWLLAAVAVVVALGVASWLMPPPAAPPSPGADPAPETAEAEPAATPAATPGGAQPEAPAVEKAVEAPVEPEPPPPQPAVTPSLAVTSEPSGAAIFLDDRETGQVTPARIELPGVPPTTLRLVKRGYRTAEAPVTDEMLRAGLVNLRLDAVERPVTVAVTGAYPFEVFDGRAWRPAAESHEVVVRAGGRLRIRATDYFLDRALPVQGAGGSRVDVRAPDLGQITVLSRPENCPVWIGDRSLGYHPTPPQDIAEGTYTIELRCKDGRGPYRRTVTVQANRLNRITMVFQP